MTDPLSPSTQVALLLTAPLITGRGQPTPPLLKPSEYFALARLLKAQGRRLGDLVGAASDELIQESSSVVQADRLHDLLSRSFQLAEAVERWRARSIWVISRTDSGYPQRFSARFREKAPPVLYGCGDPALLESGGLAVVGSRAADEELLDFAATTGKLAASAGCAVVSGAARGIDQAAMMGALEQGGRAIGVLADKLEQAALRREYRQHMMDSCLTLVTPYDPAARFQVGLAMQRNKLIYGLADAGLIVATDFRKGGTWAGAIEQLSTLRLVPVYARVGDVASAGIKAVVGAGAIPWPDIETPGQLAELLVGQQSEAPRPVQTQLPLDNVQPAEMIGATPPYEGANRECVVPDTGQHADAPAKVLLATVKRLLSSTGDARTEADVAALLGVSKAQAKQWLESLVAEGEFVKLTRPTRYCRLPRRLRG